MQSAVSDWWAGRARQKTVAAAANVAEEPVLGDLRAPVLEEDPQALGRARQRLLARESRPAAAPEPVAVAPRAKHPPADVPPRKAPVIGELAPPARLVDPVG